MKHPRYNNGKPIHIGHWISHPQQIAGPERVIVIGLQTISTKNFTYVPKEVTRAPNPNKQSEQVSNKPKKSQITDKTPKIPDNTPKTSKHYHYFTADNSTRYTSNNIEVNE